MFLGRKPRTTLDLLKPTPTLPIERNEEMEKRFNRRYGTKIRAFAIGDNVFAKHRISQNWKFGKVSKKRGVIYDVDFRDGSSGRFHANQLRPRHTPDEADQLQIFLDAFDIGKPADRQIANELEARAEHNQTVQEQGLENDLGQSDNDESMDEEAEQQIPPRRYPQRNRRAPQRYSP
ncbi:hypothetical protein niasHS_017228 [Heterodera schachtii]|uniref:Uncharacterized protein n=1 Tax=Heterodera schachtii TaxID=97005 RepID=A0ABD2I3A5_HETSC